DAAAPGELWQDVDEAAVVGRLDAQHSGLALIDVAGRGGRRTDELDRGGATVGDHRRRENTVVAGLDGVLVRPFGHQPPNLAEVTRRSMPPRDHDLDRVG